MHFNTVKYHLVAFFAFVSILLAVVISSQQLRIAIQEPAHVVGSFGTVREMFSENTSSATRSPGPYHKDHHVAQRIKYKSKVFFKNLFFNKHTAVGLVKFPLLQSDRVLITYRSTFLRPAYYMLLFRYAVFD